MNWFEYTEKNKKFLIISITLLCVAILLLTARRNVISLDGYWHLRTGLDWLQHGLSPWVDHFSFTYNGQTISDSPYLFQGLIALLVNQFGLEPGFQIYRLLSSIALLIVFLVFLRQLKASTIIYLLVLPVVVVLIQTRATVRPELISYIFSILALMLYHRAGKQLTNSSVLRMVGLIWIWSNYHSPIIGYIIFFGYFVDIALHQLKDKAPFQTWLKWCVWGFVIVLVGFLTPTLQHPLVGLFTFSAEWKDMIQEYTPTYIIYSNSLMLYLLAAISILTTILLIWRRRIGLLICCAIMVYSAVTMARMVAPAGLVILGILAWVLSEVDFREVLRKTPRYGVNLIGSGCLLIFTITLWSGVTTARNYMQENKKSPFRYPFDIVAYMKANEMPGRIFNDYSIGGFLLFELSPESKVYIDGRTNILYPIEHFKQYINALRFTEVLQTEIDTYNIELIVLPNGHPYYSIVADLQNFHLDFVGAAYSLYRQEKPNFPMFGELLAYPACYQYENISKLQDEVLKARATLPEYSPLFPFMQTVMTYSAVKNKTHYLLSQTEMQDWDDFHLRFNGLQSLQQGENLLTTDIFKHIKQWVLNDYLVTALANIHLGKWKIAEKSLYDASKVNWARESVNELKIMNILLEHIRNKSQLEYFDDSYVDKMTKETGLKFDPGNLLPLPHYSAFCPGNNTLLTTVH